MAKNVKTTRRKAAAKATRVTSPTQRVSRVSETDVRGWWPKKRADYILDLMKDPGLPYERVVKRSLRHYNEGKVSF